MTKLKILRLAKNVKQYQLADDVGISRTWLSAIESGFGIPSDEMGVKIARALGVNPQWLFPIKKRRVGSGPKKN